jgi:hypothetical protein
MSGIAFNKSFVVCVTASLMESGENISSLIIDADGEGKIICMLRLVNLTDRIY